MKIKTIFLNVDLLKNKLIPAVVFLNIVAILIVLIYLYQGYMFRIMQAENEVQNISGILQRNISEEIEKIELTLLVIRDEIEEELSKNSLNRDRINIMISRHFKRIPEADSLRATDLYGNIAYGIELQDNKPLSSITDRYYYQVLKNNREAGLVISKPVLGKISNKWVIIFAREYKKPDGSFGGVVYAPVTIDHFYKMFSSLNLGKYSNVSLSDSSGNVITRYSDNLTGDKAINSKINNPETLRLFTEKRDSALYERFSNNDKIKKIYSLRKISNQNLYVIVGLGKQQYLAQWMIEAFLFIAVDLFLILFSFVFTWQIRLTWNKLQEANNSLNKKSIELVELVKNLKAALENVKTLSGLLPICSNCKKIRNDGGYWEQIEGYIRDHSEAEFSHSICPDCIKKLYPDIYDELFNKN